MNYLQAHKTARNLESLGIKYLSNVIVAYCSMAIKNIFVEIQK